MLTSGARGTRQIALRCITKHETESMTDGLQINTCRLHGTDCSTGSNAQQRNPAQSQQDA
eukprot:4660-Heterococcus_DN1.PRE.3